MRQYFPNAKIVADRFHVVRPANQHFLRPWQQQDPAGRKNRGLLSLMRRHRWNLSDPQRANLDRYLEQYPVLKALYDAKQRLVELLLLKTLLPKHARKYAKQLMALLAQFALSPARALAETLKSWIEPIVRMWRFTKSNGITEGFHNKMEMITDERSGSETLKITA